MAFFLCMCTVVTRVVTGTYGALYSSKFSWHYFHEFRDLTSNHENIPHENLVLWWAWLCAVHIYRIVLAARMAASKYVHMYMRMRIQHSTVNSTVRNEVLIRC